MDYKKCELKNRQRISEQTLTTIFKPRRRQWQLESHVGRKNTLTLGHPSLALLGGSPESYMWLITLALFSPIYRWYSPQGTYKLALLLSYRGSWW